MNESPNVTAAPAVAATGLTLAYGDHVAIQAADCNFPRGASTAIIGPNGSGKTTLLRALSGLEHPVAGHLEVLGSPARAGRRDVAHVLQVTAVNDTVPLTVIEVVRMGRYPHRRALGRLRRDDHAAIDEAMDRMDIGDLRSRHLRELSGGQRQRVFVAQGLAQRADLLLLDEPVTGLDLVSQERIDRAIRDEVGTGRSVVYTTHDVGTAAASDHVLLLATHVIADGDPDDVLTEEHLSHAYGGTVFRTADGAVVLADPHHHHTKVEGHADH